MGDYRQAGLRDRFGSPQGRKLIQARAMKLASRLLGFVCVLVTVVLWAVTLMTDPTPGPIAAAGALTAIVAIVIALASWG